MPQISLTLSRGPVVWEDCEVTVHIERAEPDVGFMNDWAIVESVKFCNPNRAGTWHELALTGDELQGLDERINYMGIDWDA